MTTELRLNGIAIRDEAIIRVEALLTSQAGDNLWRAHLSPGDKVKIGDRLRFGDPSECQSCLLGFLDADVVEMSEAGYLLSFHFTGAALDDALARLGQRRV